MPITDILARNARDYGGEVCLVEVNPGSEARRNIGWREYELIESSPAESYRREMTWAHFDDRADRVASYLLGKGLTKGSKVALLLMNCLEWLPIYFGILRSGAVAVPLNYRYTADEIRYCLGLSESDALIFGPEFTTRVSEVRGLIPRVRTMLYAGADCPGFAESYDQEIPRCAPGKPEVSVGDGDEAAIYFSSGTTGFPKAILHDHRSLMFSCEVEREHHGQGRGDVFLCIPPLYHTGAKMHWFGSLLSGGKAVLLRGVRPEWILKSASDERATIVWLLVPWAQDILDAIDDGSVRLSDYDLSDWRLMHIGAQPVPPSLVRRWLAAFPGHAYDTNYGLSESIGPGCVHLGVANTHKVGAIGVPGHGWEAKVVDEAGAEVGAGAVGELIVKGDGVMRRYYNDPEATAASLKGGWLYTGDMAMVDADGFIHLVDRKKDVVITGGENIYPVQIEDHLRGHAAVKDVAVIGMPDRRLGEIAAAIVELKAGMECGDSEIMAFCESMPRYKRPKRIIFDKVPRNPTGKIEKPALRRKYCGANLVERQMTD
ncbi:MAG: AMP-binding protein [Oscillospiraceae bacterium]|nr:AMP-binding protein [Oscillospiraceae bacterium]